MKAEEIKMKWPGLTIETRKQRLYWSLLRFSVVLPVIVMVVLIYNTIPTSATMRLDCGDIKYTWMGLTVRNLPMSEPERSCLLTAAKGSSVAKPIWVSIQFGGTSHPDMMSRRAYQNVAAWGPVDLHICQFALEDIAAHVSSNKWAARSDPWTDTSVAMEMAPTGEWTIRKGWKSNPAIQSAAAAAGYKIP